MTDPRIWKTLRHGCLRVHILDQPQREWVDAGHDNFIQRTAAAFAGNRPARIRERPLSPAMTLLDSISQALHNVLEMTEGRTKEQPLRYFLIAGTAWVLGYVLFKRRWFHRKIIARFPRSREVWREMGYSALSLLIFNGVGVIMFFVARAGWTQMYYQIEDYGWVWFWLSFYLAIILHDTYFYWTHRLMHHPMLFPWFHRVHHLSHNPTPWAAYAFAPLEALVQAGIFPLLVCVMPMHPLAFAMFMVCQLTVNVAGHTGYEFLPRWLMDSWLGKFINTPTNHVMHHETLCGNFGLYFNIWDRLMGTNHAHYEKRFREITSRPLLTQDRADKTGPLTPPSL